MQIKLVVEEYYSKGRALKRDKFRQKRNKWEIQTCGYHQRDRGEDETSHMETDYT